MARRNFFPLKWYGMSAIARLQQLLSPERPALCGDVLADRLLNRAFEDTNQLGN